jgi:hypothetical protein
VCTDLQTVRQVGDLRRCGALRFSGSDRTREAVPSAAPVAAGRVTSWSRAGSLGRRSGLRDHGSALAVADRGCATTGLRRGGRGGEGSCGDGRPHEKGGVEAGTGEFAQPFCQLRQEWVCRGSRCFCGEQLPPLRIWVGQPGRRVDCRVAAASFGRWRRAILARPRSIRLTQECGAGPPRPALHLRC